MNPYGRMTEDDYINTLIKMYDSLQIKKQPEKTQQEKDEEILDKMDLKTIENYLRKKKLQNISNK